MTQNLKKFLNYLEEKYRNEIIEKAQMIYTNGLSPESVTDLDVSNLQSMLEIIGLLKKLDDSYYDYTDIFEYFLELTTELQNYQAKVKDKFNIVMEIISKVLSKSLLKNSLEVNNDALQESFRYIRFLFGKYSDVTNKILDRFNALLNVHKYYIIKKDNLTNDDITNTISALASLNINPDLNNCFFEYLKSILNKQNEKQKKSYVKQESPSNEAVTTPKESQLTKKEYYAISQELNSYFDFSLMKPLRILTDEEVAYCITLLRKLKVSEDKIDQFIIKSSKNIKTENINVLIKYMLMYKKLKYYQTPLNIEEELKNLEMIFSEMFISSSDDYEAWKNMFEENFNYVYSCIINSTSYEKELSLRKQES